MGHAWLVAQKRCRRTYITLDSERTMVYRDIHVIVSTIAICTSLGFLCTRSSVKLECYFTTKTSP